MLLSLVPPAVAGVLPLFLLAVLYAPDPCQGKINITHLSVPAVVKNGSDNSVLLDCEYDYNPIYDDKIAIKWYFGDEDKLIYQWLPKVNDSRAWSETIEPFVDPDFEVEDPRTRYRAIRLRKPTIALSGKYTCSVISINSSASASAYMLIYAPATRTEFSYRKSSRNSLMLSCKAEEIFPEPTIKIYKVDDDSETSESDSTKTKESTASSKEDTSESTDEKSNSTESKDTETDSVSTLENPSKDSNVSESTESDSRASRKGRKSTSKTSESDNASGSKTGSKSTDESSTKSRAAKSKSTTSESGTGSKDTTSETDSKDTKSNKKSTESDTNETVNDPDESEETSESKDTDSKSKSSTGSTDTDEKGKDSSCDESDEVPTVKVTNVLGENGFTTKIVSEFKLKNMDKETVFECYVEIPNTSNVQKQRLVYKPESSSSSSSETKSPKSSESGHSDSDETTNSDSDSDEVQDVTHNPDTEKKQAATSKPSNAPGLLPSLSCQWLIFSLAFLITW